MNPPPLPSKPDMPLLVTSEEISGMRISRSLGMVTGNATKALGFKGSMTFTGGGGDVPNLTEFQVSAQKEASRRMLFEARSLGADAVVSVRFQVSVLSAGLCSVLCYGTAVNVSGTAGE